MAITFEIRAGSERLALKLGTAEAQALSKLRQMARSEAEAVFGAKDLGVPERISTKVLLNSAEALQRAIAGSGDDLGVVYRFERRDFDGRRLSTSTGLQTRINGVDHWFDAGRDLCTMHAVYRNAQNLVIRKGEVIDLREISSIRTDNGEVLIKRAAASTDLRRVLAKIIAWVSQRHVEEVLKIVA